MIDHFAENVKPESQQISVAYTRNVGHASGQHATAASGPGVEKAETRASQNFS